MRLDLRALLLVVVSIGCGGGNANLMAPAKVSKLKGCKVISTVGVLPGGLKQVAIECHQNVGDSRFTYQYVGITQELLIPGTEISVAVISYLRHDGGREDNFLYISSKNP